MGSAPFVLPQKQRFLAVSHLAAEQHLGQQPVFRHDEGRIIRILLCRFHHRVAHPAQILHEPVISVQDQFQDRPLPVTPLESRPGDPSGLSLPGVVIPGFLHGAKRHSRKKFCRAPFRAAGYDPLRRLLIHTAPVHESDRPGPVLCLQVTGPQSAGHGAQFLHISALFIVVHEAELQTDPV